ncbi:SBBP repeat-containing protein [Pontibacter populi]|uniref:SBBP repeat-containing protein n=1 Tax=Pontibacter populi TaxID=890055 RepID=A0ABV1RR64_9BACT
MKTILLSLKSSLWLRYTVFVLILISIIYPTQVSAQDIKEEWMQRYGGDVPSQESTVKLVNDSEGNTYVAGNAFSTSLGHHIVTVKYSSSGEELWTRHYSTLETHHVSDITVDSTGDVYLVGSMFSPSALRSILLVIKYSSLDGELLWTIRRSEGRHTIGRQIELDDKGDGYVTSYSQSFVPPRQVTILTKFDAATGETIWSEGSYDRDIPEDEYDFRSFVLDSLGDVYITGTKSSAELITHKISGSDGEILWTQSNIGGHLDAAIALDNHGGVYVNGYTRTSSDGISQEFLVKYQAYSGAQLWYQNLTVDGEAISGIKNLQADAFGGVYLSGTIDGKAHIVRINAADGTTDWSTPFNRELAALALDGKGNLFASGSGTDTGYIIRKYLVSSGQQVWTVPDNDSVKDSVTAFIVSTTGTVQVAGISTLPDNTTHIFVASHNAANRELIWKTVYLGITPASDIAHGVVTDKDGNVYVTGVGGPPSPYTQDAKTEIITIKYSPAGEELWTRCYTLGNRWGELSESKIVLDNANGVYVNFGNTFLTIKYDALTGEQLWVDGYFEDGASLGSKDITVDDAGGVYVTGWRRNGIHEAVTLKYDANTGKRIWKASYSLSEEFNQGTAIAVRNGQVFVAGFSYVLGPGRESNNDIFLLKYNTADGSQIWDTTYDSGFNDVPTDMLLDSGNGLFIVGYSPGASLLKFNADSGKRIWTIKNEDQSTIAAIDNAGGIYTAGRNGGEVLVRKYNTLTAEPLWTQNYATTSSAIAHSIATDSVGGVYVAGLTDGSLTTVKYRASDGDKVWEVKKERLVDINSLSIPVDLTLDNNLNVLVIGSTFNPFLSTVDFSGYDILTIKYSQQGGNLSCFDPLQVQLSMPPQAVRVGEQVLTTADFRDYVPGEAHNIRWAWGDQSQPTIAYFSAGDSHITGEHTYTQAGIYRAGLDFSQSCLVPESYDFEEWLVIYDPAAGSVTGGGQLLSLQTQLPWMSQQLNAQFSFNVRYNQNKDTASQGQTQLNLREQGVFRSNAIEWLVVRGDQALWQGTGTLNGEGNYGFTASVWDGRGTGDDDAGDEIRIRIWDKNAGNAIVYDNFETAGDIYDMTNPTSRIVRGQIIIHPFATASKIVSQQATFYNYPNTFKDKTTITFTAKKAGNYTLEVYDMRGKLVKQFWKGQAEEGQNYSVELDGTSLPKGIYVARLVSSTGSQSIKMLLER